MRQVGFVGVVVAALLLTVTALVAASTERALEARRDGASWRRGASGPWRDGGRLLSQPRRRILGEDRLLWQSALAGLPLVALLMIAVVPLGRWTIADLGVGVVWFNMLDVCVWALVWLAGWGPNSAYSLIGGYRFLAQALAYELPLMFTLTAPVAAAGSLNVGDIVAAQDRVWFVVWMPVAFGVYCLAVAGFSLRGPLDAAVGTDLAGGVLAEAAGADRLMLQSGRYLLLVAGSAFGAALFLGGGSGPLLPGWAWMLVKTWLLVAALIAVSRRLPTLRPDRFMEVGWVVLLPLALLQVLFVAVVVVS